MAGPQGSRNAFATVVYSKKYGLRWWIGCQHGINTETLRDRVTRAHKGNPEYRDDYLYLIEIVEAHPGLKRAMAASETQKEAAE